LTGNKPSIIEYPNTLVTKNPLYWKDEFPAISNNWFFPDSQHAKRGPNLRSNLESDRLHLWHAAFLPSLRQRRESLRSDNSDDVFWNDSETILRRVDRCQRSEGPRESRIVLWFVSSSVLRMEPNSTDKNILWHDHKKPSITSPLAG
jgi:hypothetical protein